MDRDDRAHPGPADARTEVEVATLLRVLLAVAVVVVAGLAAGSGDILPWTVAVVVLDLAGETLLVRPAARWGGEVVVLVGAVLCALALHAGPSALPLVVIPLSRAATLSLASRDTARAPVERWARSWLGPALALWVLTAVVVQTRWAAPASSDGGLTLRWGVIALAAGAAAALVGVASAGSTHRRVHKGGSGVAVPRMAGRAPAAGEDVALAPGTASADTPAANAAATEAAHLLSQLDLITSELRGGLDPATAAELMLDSLGRPGPLARSAVLIGSPTDACVPLALRGSDRVPWGEPSLGLGAVGHAWLRGESCAEWDPRAHREVRAVPLRTHDGEQIGVMVQDVMATAPSDEDELQDVWEVAEQHGPVIGVALAFAGLRERAGFEERERLAREMHDGIAQELVALGFQLDLVTRTLATPPPPSPSAPDAARPVDPDPAGVERAERTERAAQMLEQARAALRRVLGDLRSQISDLRVSVRPERGLGATMSSRLQTFGTAHQKVVSLRLDETAFRLPARVETVLYQLFLDVLTDVVDGGATGIDVDLSVAASEAYLRLRHDGSTQFSTELMVDHPVSEAGGRCVVTTDGGLDLAVSFAAPPTVVAPIHLDQKVPQAS